MATFDASDVGFFLLDGYDLLPWTEKVTDGGCELQTDEVLPLGASTPYAKSIRRVKGALGMSGLLDAAALASHPALSESRGSSRVAGLAPLANSVGTVFTGANVVQTKYDPVLDAERLTRFECGLVCGEFDRGIVVAELDERTADGDSTASYTDETGASSANGAAAYLFVTALDLGGYDSCTITLQHSADHSTWADLVAFTTVDAAQTAERKLATGTVNRYMAATWAFVGSGSDPSISFAVGAARL